MPDQFSGAGSEPNSKQRLQMPEDDSVKFALLVLVFLGSQFSLAADAVVGSSGTKLLELDGQAVGPERAQQPRPDAPELISPCYRGSPADAVADFSLNSFPELFEPSLSSYWPGLNGSVWLSRSGNQLYAIRDLRVLRSSLATVGQPSLTIYDESGAPLLREDLLNLKAVNTSRGLLLTGFFRENAVLNCLDILMAGTSRSAARGSRLYFSKAGTLFTKTLELRRLMPEAAKERR